MDYFLIPLCIFSILYVLFHIFKFTKQRLKSNQNCYMLAYQCYRATEDRRLDAKVCASIALRNKNLGIEEYKFLVQNMINSGVGEQTYAPRNVINGDENCPKLSDSISELEEIFFGTLDQIFFKSGISPQQIDILVVNVSMFVTLPSLTSRIINHYRMRSDIKSFNLSGMGCSGSIISINLVQQLFKIHENSIAVVVSTEAFGSNWYGGKEKSMMLSNCLFRLGGVAMIFTNNPDLKNQAILKLNHLVRADLGSNQDIYECAMQIDDSLGYRGMRLNRNLTKSAAKTLTSNLQIMVPKILPWKELIRYVVVSVRKKGGINLKTGVEHFCIHPGGKAVIDGVGKSLGLNEYDLEPARMALYRFGNISSASPWYALSYMEAKKRLKKGDRILMISFGAGFQCQSCLWEVMKNLGGANIWKDCIDNFPPKNLSSAFMEKLGWLLDENVDYPKEVEHVRRRIAESVGASYPMLS
ncbi:hypothetical protein M9H77_28687 [Catharanthus roseus]|uniref:Uncharacterized protein n=1 Tax=Catharanthus roseus TaxID=4058 RepID=A0ACC0AIA0_CATRO|nr:hypothetical protein M9H77_28687 [Catharanthus roseus]